MWMVFLAKGIHFLEDRSTKIRMSFVHGRIDCRGDRSNHTPGIFESNGFEDLKAFGGGFCPLLVGVDEAENRYGSKDKTETWSPKYMPGKKYAHHKEE